jgi:hypothetical protein
MWTSKWWHLIMYPNISLFGEFLVYSGLFNLPWTVLLLYHQYFLLIKNTSVLNEVAKIDVFFDSVIYMVPNLIYFLCSNIQALAIISYHSFQWNRIVNN